MLYTGNGNRLIFWIFIPGLLILYIAFRMSEWQFSGNGDQHKKITEQHLINLSNLNDINCLILGGSNSWFGLSAEQMSNDSNLSCYNLSLLSEGFSFEAYWDYIRSLSIEVEKIDYVFYSGIVPYNPNNYLLLKRKNALNEIGVSGDHSFRLLGSSIAFYVKSILQNEHFSFALDAQYPLPSSFGDFVFSTYKGCRSDLNIRSMQNDDFNSLEIWANSQLSEIITIFPNAKRFFVLPAERRSRHFDLSIQAEMIEHIQRSVSAKNSLNTTNYLIVQPPIDDNSLLCDGQHHPNAKGRESRTSNLIQLFNEIL